MMYASHEEAIMTLVARASLLAGLLLPFAGPTPAFGSTNSPDVVVTYGGGVARFGYDVSSRKLVKRYETPLPSAAKFPQAEQYISVPGDFDCLFTYTYDVKRQQLVGPGVARHAPGYALGAVADGNVFAVDSDTLFRLNGKGLVSGRVYLPSVRAIAPYNGRLLASSQEQLVCISNQLQVLGQVDLYVDSSTKKNADDIIAYDGVAYLLDDVILPMYVLRCSIPESGDPVIFQRDYYEGVNPHLGTHWLDRSLGWHVVSLIQGSGYIGPTLDLVANAMSGTTWHAGLPTERIPVARPPFSDSAQRVWDFMDVTPVDPVWAIVRVGKVRRHDLHDGDFYVGRVSTDSGVFRLLDSTKLVLRRSANAPSYGIPARLASSGGKLYVLWAYGEIAEDDGRDGTPFHGSALQVYDIQSGVPRLLDQKRLVAHNPVNLYLVER
jgi:hypothetical protein